MNPLRARLVLGAALVLGASGDLLFRAERWGLNLVGWVALALLAALGTGWARPFGFDRSTRSRDLLIALAGTFIAATGLVLRDDPALIGFDLLAMLTASAVAVWLAAGRSLSRFRVRDLFRSWGAAFAASVTGAPALALRDAAGDLPGERYQRPVRAVLVGTFLAVPPVFVVGALLAQADPLFGDFLTSWRHLGLEELAGHVALGGVIAWPAAGWLRGLVTPTRVAPVRVHLAASRLDFLGVAPALYAVVGLLAAYLGVQARALFGGAGYVEATTGVTYAEYARRGFFELVAVTAISLLLLLIADWALDRHQPKATHRFQVTGWVLLALLGVLMASALQRMWLYVSYYGLSDTRLYATAAMAWLGATLAWFGWTILRGRRARFGVGLLVLSAGWVAGLNIADPERVVVEVNFGRALAGKEFDVPYHTSLSLDALPSLLAAAEQLPVEDCRGIIAALARRRPSLDADWRSWTLPRSRAARLLAAGDAALITARCAGHPSLTP